MKKGKCVKSLNQKQEIKTRGMILLLLFWHRTVLLVLPFYKMKNEGGIQFPV